jgi:hypothetical protein
VVATFGAWLQGILRRDPKGYGRLKERVPGPSQTDPITFLRRYSNYLAPRVGLSLDAIVIPVIWLRNVMLNQAIIVAAFASLCLLLLLPGAGVRALANGGSTALSWGSVVLALLFGGIAVFQIGRNLRAITRRVFEKSGERAFAVGQGTERVGTWVVMPVVLAVVCLLLASSSHGQELSERRCISFLLLWLLIALLQRAGGFLLCYADQHRFREKGARRWLEPRLQLLWISFATALFTYVILYEVSRLLSVWSPKSPEGSQNAIAWMPPLYLAALMLGISLQVGLMGRDFPDASREWLARTGALMATVAGAWAFLFAVGVFSPYWVAGVWLTKKTVVVSWTTAWLVSTLASVMAGKSGKTDGGEEDKKTFSVPLDRVARYGPFVAVPGFLVAVAFGTQALLESLVAQTDGPFLPVFFFNYWQRCPYQSAWKIYFLLLGELVAVFVLLSLRVNINEFSLHHFYKNRLVRCYLGASATGTPPPLGRVADSFTGFDPHDDIPLDDLKWTREWPTNAPYPIINAAMTITAGSELATQERKAIPWIFTPRYSGFVPARSDADKAVLKDDTCLDKGFAKSCEILGGNLHLGTATAISGAAVSPNMGFHSAPQTAFLLTLFNVRLGWWIGNPRDAGTYWRSGPLFALWWLARELLGFVNASSGFLNLSDGGHFENLGLYELVRRRCRYVIAVDGEADSNYIFGSLGGAVRKCRADFGVEIKIDPRPIQPEKGHSRSHCVVGRIQYPEPDTEPGWLLYIKASITGDEPADVEEYRREHVEFPQQSTADQFFSESQFESYRRLGLHVSEAVLDHLDIKLTLEESFARLSARWELPPQAPDGAFSRHADAYSKLMNRLSTSAHLSVLDSEVFENVDPDLAKNSKYRESFFFCLDLFELIESVFFDLNLASEHSWNHPGNAGWKRNFEYWAHQPSIRNVWRAQKQNYGTSFQDFFNDLVDKNHSAR